MIEYLRLTPVEMTDRQIVTQRTRCGLLSRQKWIDLANTADRLVAPSKAPAWGANIREILMWITQMRDFPIQHGGQSGLIDQ